LAFGRLGLQPRLGLPQSRQPPGRAGQRGRELIAPQGTVLAVLGLIGLGGLLQDLVNLVLQLGQRAVGPAGGVGSHLRAIQRDYTQADHPGRGAQPQRPD
jgi:hypothetical protein